MNFKARSKKDTIIVKINKTKKVCNQKLNRFSLNNIPEINSVF